MIFVTGDVHGDKNRFQAVKKAGCRKGDTLLICGDFGFLWDGGKAEQRQLKKIGKRRHYTLFVDGCNENHRLLAEYPVVDFMGGKARQISGRLYALLRGEVYEIDGKRFLAMGGGDPWEEFAPNKNEEYLLASAEELENARQNMARVDNTVDFILTHDAPPRICEFLNMGGQRELTPMHAYFSELTESAKFKRWYIGKFHQNHVVPPRYFLVFTNVLRHDI